MKSQSQNISVQDGVYKYPYTYNDKEYIQIWKVQKGPQKILAAYARVEVDDEEEEDIEITNTLIKYINPEGQICSTYITVDFLGKEIDQKICKIEIMKLDGSILSFIDKEAIVI